MGWSSGKNEMKNWQREQMPRKWREKGDDEDGECDGRTVLKEIWKEWGENGEQQQQIGVRDLIENVVREK